MFVKSAFTDNNGDPLRRVVPAVKKSLAMRRVLAKDTIVYGCTTSHYVSTDNDPTVSVALVHFPQGTSVSKFHIKDEKSVNLDWKQKDWHQFVGVPFPQQEDKQQNRAQTNIMLLQHPDFDCMEDVLSGLDFAYPGIRKLGAAAGKTNPMHKAYLFDAEGALDSGVLGLVFSSPDVQVDVTVAQGARGVGPLLEVVQVRQGNEITKVKEVNTPGATEAAPMVLLDMWAKTDLITPEDRLFARKYLLFGVEVQKIAELAVSSLNRDESNDKGAARKKEAEAPIEMVIRKVVGFNEATKSLGVEGGDVRLGSRVQFQIRDEEAARAELTSRFNKLSLEGSSKAMEGMTLMGALLLVDSERGVNLYGNVTPDLDREMYFERFPVPLVVLTSDKQVGPLPTGGLFGEAGNTFALSASALYVSFYGRTSNDRVETGDNSDTINTGA